MYNIKMFRQQRKERQLCFFTFTHTKLLKNGQKTRRRWRFLPQGPDCARFRRAPTLDATNRRRRFLARRRGVDDWPRDDVGSRIGHRPPSDGFHHGTENDRVRIRAEQRRRSVIIVVQWCSRRRENEPVRGTDGAFREMSRTKHGQRGAVPSVRGLVDVV